MHKPVSDTAAPPPATVHPLLIASIVASAFFMENFDTTVIVTALPRMAQAFDVTPVALSLGLTSYILALAVMLPASGWIADRFGVRTVFMTAIAGFVIASVFCGLAQSLPQFIAMRCLQGAAGAMMSPVGRLLVLRMTDKKDLVRAFNFLTFPGLIGPLIAPPIGGFIATYADWRWIFFINIPIGLLGFVLVRRYVPDLRVEGRRTFDWTGFVLNGSALAALLFGLELVIHSHNGGMETGLALAAAGVVLAWLASAHYRRSKLPLVDISALRIKTFAIATTFGGSFFRLAISGPTFVLPLFLQLGLGYSAFTSGLLIFTHTAGDIAIKSITTATLKRFGFRKVLISTASAFAIFIGFLGFVTNATPLPLVIVVLIVAGAVRSLQMTALGGLQFADVPQDKMTGASTYASVNLQVTRAVGIALAALVLNTATALHGGVSGEPGIGDFHIAFIGSALLAIAAVVRYLALPADAGAHVSAGRS